jgi:hypothetical protein
MMCGAHFSNEKCIQQILITIFEKLGIKGRLTQILLNVNEFNRIVECIQRAYKGVRWSLEVEFPKRDRLFGLVIKVTGY